jgi:Domain of unknown function (DUF5658)
MSRRFVAAAVVALAMLSVTARSAFAQGASGEATAPSLAIDNTAQPQAIKPEFTHRSTLLSSLYVSTAVMQGLDAHSTLSGLSHGAAEANPFVSGIASNRFAFVALKASVATGTILAARSMAKHNKIAAVVTLIGINSAYAAIVSHNYRVARAGK